MSRKLTTEEAVHEFREVHDNRYDYSLFIYVTSKTKSIVICKTHGQFLISHDKHKSGQGCRQCGIDLRTAAITKKQNDAINDFRKTHGDTYDYSKFIYSGAFCKGTIICPIHGEFEQIARDHARGSGCPKCSIIENTLSQASSKEDVILSFQKVHDLRYGYDLVLYVNAHTKVDIICYEHGVFAQTPDSHSRGSGCPKCKNSLGANRIFKFLTDSFINFESEKRFHTCRNKAPLPFDFHLTDYKILIEFQGKQHFQKSDRTWDTVELLAQRQKHDKIKRDWCANNGYYLLEICYDEEHLIEDLILAAIHTTKL